MTEADKQLLAELEYGIISTDSFIELFSVDLSKDFDFVKREMRKAIVTENPDEIQMTLALVWISGEIPEYIDLFNELLINPNHWSHQPIAKALQDFPSPTTVPFVRKALESNFGYLEYTASESSAIAKWFSWLLFSIGTTEAIALMKEYATSSDEGVRNEMIYRLNKLKF